ncbi:dual specificity protein phosphatase 12-like [Apostichopus japonicus]|uniref:dual specificity protein phosphatase 12-like n=1 Tax=Stichopus japonicus TaxID=307972 RepID=UPI003AB7724C
MFSANEIIPGLWLGARSDVECEKGNYLIKHKITHVLSIESQAPSIYCPDIKYKFIEMDDQECADLLVHLGECFTFIEEARQAGSVLVHCLVGMSRSASVVTAYLMNKDKISLESALDKVKEKRFYVRPNQGFMEQLSLFEAMGCDLNPHHTLMKFHKLGQYAQQREGSRRERSVIPKELLEKDPNQKSPSGQGDQEGSVFRCRKCRRALFKEGSLIGHSPGRGQLSFKWHKQGQPLAQPEEGGAEGCTSHFIHPVAWMEEFLLGQQEGKLSCPKCSARIGCFYWAGQQCSCGAWITPAFQIHKNRVDRQQIPQLPR